MPILRRTLDIATAALSLRWSGTAQKRSISAVTTPDAGHFGNDRSFPAVKPNAST